ncbi:MAG: sugar phosphate nucleotidyltransferase [Pseudomonadota bacterium]|nr:sugar phosphate nucleotidyltransferase [Pseudomonadota bacterium]
MNFPVLILAGGFGTRLKSAIGDIPKPIAPVGDKTFLYFLISNLYRQSVREIVFSLHFKAELVIAEVKKMSLPQDLKLKFVTESEPMGTGGAIKFCWESCSNSEGLIVVNGDTYLSSGIQEIEGNNFRDAVIGLTFIENTFRYGCVDLDDNELVVAFTEKSHNKSGWINNGLYRLPAHLLNTLPQGKYSLETNIFPKWCLEGKIKGLKLDGEFIDIGVPEDYQNFQKNLKQFTNANI